MLMRSRYSFSTSRRMWRAGDFGEDGCDMMLVPADGSID
jgi:hypothetical protein